MFDPPHLMKSIRNNLKRHGFTKDGADVSWEFVERFYQMDSSLPIRMAPKLTKRHILVPTFADLNVKLAAQVLSHTVAAGITTMIKPNAIPPTASATAEFIDSFDKLFNCFNSRTLKQKTSGSFVVYKSSKAQNQGLFNTFITLERSE
ncbi:transposable element p transposase-like protein [Plakobranchus ocellatus]|uniref:Transposable element p transposase-like protein n=1 Tax=Plakobranchus ocellatus TaxID=259542 RepID=A0AAV4A004_9GAST|nr:transposable element p transposase-like protein [Plakobranchus ocellatus]